MVLPALAFLPERFVGDTDNQALIDVGAADRPAVRMREATTAGDSR